MADWPSDFCVAECTVTQLCFDSAVTLLVVSPTLDYTTIRIDGPFELMNPSGEFHRIDPVAEISPSGLTDLRKLLHQTVVSGHVEDDGTARFSFSAGATITIESHEAFEAWDVNKDATGEKWIARPRGDVAYWPPNVVS